MMTKLLKNKKVLLAGGLLALVILYHFTSLQKAGLVARDRLLLAGGKIFSAGREARYFWQGISGGRRWQKEAAGREEALAQLAQENSRLHQLETKNEELRSLLDLKKNLKRNFIAADILLANVFSGKKIIIISRGENDGLKIGWPVVAPSGVLVGKIIELAPETAKVLLITDNDSTIAARPANNPEISTIVRGNNGLGLTMELIPQAAALSVGDIIVTSSLEENTPPGLPLGRLATVSYKEGELFQTAALSPLASSDNLRTVAIIVP